MCGRYVNTASKDVLAELFDAPVIGEPLPPPSFQVHPTDEVRVVLESKKQPGRRLEGARWDLARPRQQALKHSRPPLINMRVETAQQKFGWALKNHRCIIPATGYWEWTGKTGNKQPYYFHHDSDVLAFAGVYSWWEDPARAGDDPDRWTLTAALFTMDAAPHLAQIHDRNPLMLPEDFWDDWLDTDTAGDQSLVDAAVAIAQPYAQEVQFYPVRKFSGRDDGPDLTAPLT